MFKFLILSVLIVFFGACGVNTSSSPIGQTNSGTSTDSNTDNTVSNVSLDLIDPNPVYSEDNSTSGSGSTDVGGSGTDTNTSTGTVADQANSIFDVSGAVLDEHACIIGNRNEGYADISMQDTSADDRSKTDESYGVIINSELALNRVDSASTTVTVFYNALTVQRDGTWQNIRESSLGYQLSVDTAWDRNDKKIMYVMTPKNTDGYYGCYRYNFSSPSEGTFTSTRTKVYRNNI